mmetsp:Transcript_35242/g.101360  ORF Transcript_35242/g.101360 Transcript_35242/m.101360 type:complete len:93 (+) Transcript_35242:1361-1639(+)
MCRPSIYRSSPRLSPFQLAVHLHLSLPIAIAIAAIVAHLSGLVVLTPTWLTDHLNDALLNKCGQSLPMEAIREILGYNHRRLHCDADVTVCL